VRSPSLMGVPKKISKKPKDDHVGKNQRSRCVSGSLDAKKMEEFDIFCAVCWVATVVSCEEGILWKMARYCHEPGVSQKITKLGSGET